MSPDDYDSYSCENFAAGDPKGDPALEENALCLNGSEGQYLAIPYLNNWFAWNPNGQAFTLCFWFKVGAGQSGGLFSSNLGLTASGSVADFWLVNGELYALMGQTTLQLGVFPGDGVWESVCITFDFGQYVVYYNGAQVATSEEDEYPVNSQTPAALGHVDGLGQLESYFDDFCFWTSVLDDAVIADIYSDGRSD